MLYICCTNMTCILKVTNKRKRSTRVDKEWILTTLWCWNKDKLKRCLKNNANGDLVKPKSQKPATRKNSYCCSWVVTMHTTSRHTNYKRGPRKFHFFSLPPKNKAKRQRAEHYLQKEVSFFLSSQNKPRKQDADNSHLRKFKFFSSSLTINKSKKIKKTSQRVSTIYVIRSYIKKKV